MEEVKYHGRMPALLEMENLYLPEYPLDRLVDIASPESRTARVFAAEVEEGNRNAILESLTKWASSAVALNPYLQEDAKLRDLAGMNKELILISEELISRIEKGQAVMSDSVLNHKLSYLETGENGLILAIVPSLRKLQGGL